MPFIHIRSLPFDKPLNVPQTVAAIARDFSQATGVELRHIHTTWSFYQPGHYAKGDTAPNRQPEKRHPVIVDLLTPDFNDADTIALMLQTVAAAIAKRVKVPLNNIFIHHRQAQSGMVFDEGKMIRW